MQFNFYLIFVFARQSAFSKSVGARCRVWSVECGGIFPEVSAHSLTSAVVKSFMDRVRERHLEFGSALEE